MMTKRSKDWDFHGESEQDELIAGLLPSRGVHHLIADKEVSRSLAGEIAVAVAGGVLAGGLSEPDAVGRRRSTSGFFGCATGEPKGVAVIGATDRRTVIAASLARGVRTALPIALSRARTSDLLSVQLHRMRHEMAGGVGLVIVAADFSRPGEIQRVAAYRSDDYALLVIAPQEPPAALMEPNSHVLRVMNDALHLERPATLNGWKREFALETIIFPQGEAQIVKPNLFGAEPPIVVVRAAPALVASQPAPEPKITQRVVFAMTGNSIGEAERARWPGHYFAQSVAEAVKAAQAASADGVTEITVVASHRGGDAAGEARRVETALHAANLTAHAIVRVSEKQLLDPHAVAA